MVEQRHTEQRAPLDKAPRDFSVLGAGSRIATRVVVHDYERRRSFTERGPEDLAGVHQAGCEGSSRGHHFSQHAVATVEEQQMELLVRSVAETRVEVQEDVLGTSDRNAALESAFREPPTELERGEQRCGLGGPDPLVPLELGRESAREPAEPLASEQSSSERLDGAPSGPRSEQQNKKLDVVERLGTVLAKTLARTSPRIDSLHDGLPGDHGVSGL